jgi:hypothetical protein
MIKTTKQRAEEFVQKWFGANHVAYTTMVEQLTLSFKEHARDQRHACVESTTGPTAKYDGISDVQCVVMNTRAPGE